MHSSVQNNTRRRLAQPLCFRANIKHKPTESTAKQHPKCQESICSRLQRAEGQRDARLLPCRPPRGQLVLDQEGPR
jgi:hypothetical protein